MSVKKQQGCPYCSKIIPAGGEHQCADPTKSFLTAHNYHEDVQPLKGAYPDSLDGPRKGKH